MNIAVEHFRTLAEGGEMPWGGEIHAELPIYDFV